MSTDLVKLGVNIAGAGLVIAMFGLAPRITETSERLMWGGLYVSMFSSLFRINNPR